MTLNAVLTGQPDVDLDRLSPAENAQVLARVIDIAKPFFSMRPKSIYTSETFRTLDSILSDSLLSTKHRKSYSQTIDTHLSVDTPCLLLDKTPSEQEVYRMPSKTRYKETSLLVMIDGRLILWRSDVVCEHDGIVDATFYEVITDELTLIQQAQAYYQLEPSPSVRQAIFSLRSFLEKCVKQVEPLNAASVELKQLFNRLGA